MREGIATGLATFEQLISEVDWTRDDLSKTVCHQVGKAHRALMLEALGIPIERDHATFEWLGNTGSVALPISLAMAAQHGHITAKDQVGLLGIGSGINSVMMTCEWSQSRVQGIGPLPDHLTQQRDHSVV